MKTIIMKQLAMTDLCFSFVRSDTLEVYKLSLAEVFVNSNFSKDNSIIRSIKKEEGKDVEVVFENLRLDLISRMPPPAWIKVPDNILDRKFKKVLHKLRKTIYPTTILQLPLSFRQKLAEMFPRWADKVTEDRRSLAFAEYIAVKCDSLSLITAIDTIMEDLLTLNKAGLIKGCLLEPSVAKMHDGSYAVACFPFVLNTKERLASGGSLEYLKRLGVKHANHEGDLGELYASPQKYKYYKIPFKQETADSLDAAILEAQRVNDERLEKRKARDPIEVKRAADCRLARLETLRLKQEAWWKNCKIE
jgi:hypothetical protein